MRIRGVIGYFASPFVQRARRLYYGKYYHPRLIATEKKITEKVHNIDGLFTKAERKAILRKGFCSDKLLWYDFKRYKAEDYISDYDHYALTELIDWHQYYVANDKLVCERMLAPFCNIVPSIGYVFRGGWYYIGNQYIVNSIDDLLSSIIQGKEYFFKPNGGGGGRGIGCLHFVNGQYYWNDEVIKQDVKEFVLTLSKGNEGYVVQERFKQIGFSHDANPDTLNTLRVVTMMSPSTHEPFVAFACHRIGRKGAFVDNIAKANLLCPIDKKTGEILDVLVPPVEGKVLHLEKHPDTNVQLKGVVISNWDKVIETALMLSKQVPFMPLCGWDLILSDGEVYMQELNYNPDIYLGQGLKPLLLDEQVKEFFNYYCKRP